MAEASEGNTIILFLHVIQEGFVRDLEFLGVNLDHD